MREEKEKRKGWPEKTAAKAGKACFRLLFPEGIYCISCGRPILPAWEDSLCPDCRKVIFENRGGRCPRCGRPMEGWKSHGLCPDCRYCLPLYSRGKTCCVYKGRVKGILYDFKYGGKAFLARPLAFLMAEEGFDPAVYDLILPVPMAKAKMRRRGYNQAALLGRELGRLTGKPCEEDILIRNRETAPMSGLSREERRENLKDAICVTKPRALLGKRVLLVDDIYTTGATMGACSQAVLSAGAKEVFALTFAMASPEKGIV